MNRKEFLKKVGLTTGGVLVATCVCACSKEDESGASGAIDTFTIDISKAEYSKLKTKGQYVAMNGVIVAHTLTGKYIVVQQICTHEVYKLIYQSSKKRFYCGKHGATFNENGAVTKGPAKVNLTTYKVAKDGDKLTIS